MKKEPIFVFFSVLLLLAHGNEDALSASAAPSDEKIYCVASESADETEVFRYDCSSKNLRWRSLSQLIDLIRASSSLNLANNSLGSENTVVRDLAFNLFKQLIKLNLTSNGLSSIQAYAFYYSNQVSDSVDLSSGDDNNMRSQWRPLQLTHLDLSDNLFKTIPWNSVKSLPQLQELTLNRNPIRTFDMGDLLIGNDSSSLFPNLTHVYANTSAIEYVDSSILEHLSQLVLLDLRANRIKYLDIDVRNKLMLIGSFRMLFVADNPLVCNCKLVWLKDFLQKYGGHMANKTNCYINNKINEKVYLIETKSIFINSSFKSNRNHLKVVNVKNFNGNGNGFNNNNNNRLLEDMKLVEMDKLNEQQFYCDLDLTSSVRDLPFVDPDGGAWPRKQLQEIQLTCQIRSYPEAKLKWLFGKKDLYKQFTYENKQFNIVEKSEFNTFDYEYVIESKLIIAYSGNRR
jgi:hypothetical protein